MNNSKACFQLESTLHDKQRLVLFEEISALSCFETRVCGIEHLEEGASHQCFKVTMNSQLDTADTGQITQASSRKQSAKLTDYFVKLFDHHSHSAANEVFATKLAATHKIGPSVFYHCTKWLVTEFIVGQSLLQSSLTGQVKISHALDLMAATHQLPIGEQLSSLDLSQILTAQIQAGDYPDLQRQKLTRLSQALTEFEPSGDLVLCHGDVNFSNIIISAQGQAQLIDFECANLAAVEFDLAMFIAINHIDLNEIPFVIEYYQQKSGRECVAKLVKSYLACCYLLNGLWYLQAFKRTPSNKKLQQLGLSQFTCLDQLALTPVSEKWDKILSLL